MGGRLATAAEILGAFADPPHGTSRIIAPAGIDNGPCTICGDDRAAHYRSTSGVCLCNCCRAYMPTGTNQFTRGYRASRSRGSGPHPRFRPRRRNLGKEGT